MRYWIVPTNNKFFRIDDLLAERNQVYWRQMNRFAPGDVVFLYSSSPQSRIAYQMEVIKVGIPSTDCDTNESYWVNKTDYQKSLSAPRAELRLIYRFPPTPGLQLKQLKENGLKSQLQGTVSVEGDFLKFILSSINALLLQEEYSIDDKSEIIPLDKTLKEGATVLVNVNRYERNRIARDECIKLKGCKCCVCGFDFEKAYGKLGKGYIHVHHITPISSIGKEYKLVDTDLVPVCPNCHYMLHRKNPPYTIEELKEIMKKLHSSR